MCYMLDTNICVYATRCEDAALLEKLEGFFAGDLVMSGITLAELEAGVRRDAGLRHRRQQALAELVRFIEPVAFDERTAACFGELQVAMADRRRGAYDRLIAAHAISLWLPLVQQRPGFPGHARAAVRELGSGMSDETDELGAGAGRTACMAGAAVCYSPAGISAEEVAYRRW